MIKVFYYKVERIIFTELIYGLYNIYRIKKAYTEWPKIDIIFIMISTIGQSNYRDNSLI